MGWLLGMGTKEEEDEEEEERRLVAAGTIPMEGKWGKDGSIKSSRRGGLPLPSLPCLALPV